MIYLKILLPLFIEAPFSYSVPQELIPKIGIGKRALVQLGKAKLYTGIIIEYDKNINPDLTYKPILDIIDEVPIVNETQIDLWKWIAEYYMCTTGEVMKAALPSRFKLSSETQIRLNRHYQNIILDDQPEISKKEEILLRNLQNMELKLSEVSELLQIKNPMTVIRRLLDQSWIETAENLEADFQTQLIQFIGLNPGLETEERQIEALDALKRAPKQQAILLFLFDKENQLHFKGQSGISKKEVLKQFPGSDSPLKILLKKNVCYSFFIPLKDTKPIPEAVFDLPELSDNQQKALEQIEQSFAEKKPALLHGVTGSGKTEIYMHLIEKNLKENAQVLYLLPEIGLTTQIIYRLEQVFGKNLLIYHSKFSDQQRAEVYYACLDRNSNQPQLILGARSSIFLPFNRLKLIIVDEEHENTYKQNMPAPRYHARDVSLMLAKMNQANIVLGSATPSLESYYLAKGNRYSYVSLSQRYGLACLPKTELIDLKKARKKKQVQDDFSNQLLRSIEEAIDKNEQVILFQNRRGYNPYLFCPTCNAIPKCKQCDVSLTFHRAKNELTCHYCGYAEEPDSRCKHCGHFPIEFKGFGTEKLEDNLKKILPNAKIARLDLDTAKSKKNYEKILHDFAQQKINILIGTQMISKGLDFDMLSLSGIINADSMLNFPDFRAYERSFQLMMQVGGRAGRRDKQGQVIIQTSDLEHPILKFLLHNDYEGMAFHQLQERKLFKYPPYYRLIQISLKHKNEKVCEEAAQFFAGVLRNEFADNLLGPETPAVARVQLYYLRNILIKIQRNQANQATKEFLLFQAKTLLKQQIFKSLQIQFDVDPQ